MNMKSFRTGVAASVGGAVLLGGLLVGASIARADNSTGSTQTTPNHISDSRTGEFAHFHGIGVHGIGAAIDELANELGLSVDELRQKLGDGATLQELADAAGVDVDTVIANVKDRLEATLDDEVTAGHLSQEQADAIKAKIDSLDLGNLSLSGLRGQLRDGASRGLPFLGRHGDWLGDLNLGIDLDQLRAKLDSGLSLKEALTELGVDVDSVVAQMKQSALDKIDQMVKDGTITQDRADELKQMVETFDLGDRLPLGPGAHLEPGTFGPRGHMQHGPQANGPQFFNRDRGSDTPAGSGDV